MQIKGSDNLHATGVTRKLINRLTKGEETLYASTFLLYRSVGAATAAMLFTSK